MADVVAVLAASAVGMVAGIVLMLLLDAARGHDPRDGTFR